MRSKNLIAAAVSVVACLAVAAPTWAATSSVTVTVTGPGGEPAPTTRSLDAHDSDDGHFAGPVTTQVLTDGAWYVSTVVGTISFYDKNTWTHPKAPWNDICGYPGNRPQYGSPGVSNGMVGMDAETVFARPCSGPAGAKYPKIGRWNNFEVKTDAFFRHPDVIGGPFTSPSWSSAYDYAIKGHGKAAQFRLRDIPGTADNYGRLIISTTKATWQDCWYGRYKDFGYSDQQTCYDAMWAQND